MNKSTLSRILRESIRTVLRESVSGPLMISGGGGENFAITNTGDYFSVSIYDDDFRDAFIDKLEQAKSIGTFLETENGLQTTAPEGFVAVDRISNNALKLVNRLEFSKANFTVSKDWVKG